MADGLMVLEHDCINNASVFSRMIEEIRKPILTKPGETHVAKPVSVQARGYNCSRCEKVYTNRTLLYGHYANVHFKVQGRFQYYILMRLIFIHFFIGLLAL